MQPASHAEHTVAARRTSACTQTTHVEQPRKLANYGREGGWEVAEGITLASGTAGVARSPAPCACPPRVAQRTTGSAAAATAPRTCGGEERMWCTMAAIWRRRGQSRGREERIEGEDEPNTVRGQITIIH